MTETSARSGDRTEILGIDLKKLVIVVGVLGGLFALSSSFDSWRKREALAVDQFRRLDVLEKNYEKLTRDMSEMTLNFRDFERRASMNSERVREQLDKIGSDVKEVTAAIRVADSASRDMNSKIVQLKSDVENTTVLVDRVLEKLEPTRRTTP